MKWFQNWGAGFIVALTGDVMTMPGLPKRPAALNMDVAADGTAISFVLIDALMTKNNFCSKEQKLFLLWTRRML